MKRDISKRLRSTTKKIGRVLDKRSPEILIGCGIVGFVTTVILVAKEAPIAKERLDELHENLGESDEEISKGRIIFEEFKTAAPVYIPAVITGTMSVGCILGSHYISSKRTAALATAYEFVQSNFIDYQDKVKEKLGEKKERELKQELDEEKLKKDPPPDHMLSYGGVNGGTEVVYTDGLSLYKDGYSGRYFRCNNDILVKAEKRITERLFTEMWVSLNEFWWELGLSSEDVGDDVGFNVDDGIDIDPIPTKLENGDTVTVIHYTPKLKMF